MNRREFGLATLASGLVLALNPRVVLAEEYTHVAGMYPWDGVYRTEDELRKAPFAQPPAPRIIRKEDATPDKFIQISQFFKNPRSMETVINNLLDNSLLNDDLSALYLDKKRSLVAFRLLTNDTSFAPKASTSEEDKRKYGNVNYYCVSENMSLENIDNITKTLNIKL